MDALKQRKEKKGNKPKFVQQDAHKMKRLKQKWRRPRGLQSKMRLNRKGYNKPINVGYGSPKAAYGLHPSGLKEIIVKTESDIKTIDSKTQGATISSTIGQRKKIDIVKKLQEAKIKILNIKDVDSFVKKIEQIQSDKKKSRIERKDKQKKASEKKKEEKAAKKAAKEEAKKATKVKPEESVEDQKKQDKKEKDKILEKGQ